MKKNLITAIAGAMVLCMMTAGCGSNMGTAPASDASDAAVTAATEAPAAAATASTAAETAEEESAPAWQDLDDSYLSGITAGDYVELPDNYKHLKVKAVKPKDATDEDVDKEIQEKMKANAALEEVDRKARKDDIVNIEFVIKLDGEEVEGGSGTYDLLLGSHIIDELEEGLIGAKKGETREVKVTLPENFGLQELAGKETVFSVTVNKISEYNLPELDDEYVRSLNVVNSFGNAVTTVDDYRDFIRSNIDESRESDYRRTVLAACMDELLKESTFVDEIPVNMVDQYYDSEMRMLQYYALMNYMELKDYMINEVHATEDNYMEMIRNLAETQMKADIILQAIADKRDLNPTEDEVKESISKYVESEEMFTSTDDLGRYAKEFLRDEIMRKNVYDWIFSHCKVEEVVEEEPAEEADAADTAAETAATDETAAAAEEEKSGDDKSEEDENADTGESAEESKEGNTGENAPDEEDGEAEKEDK